MFCNSTSQNVLLNEVSGYYNSNTELTNKMRATSTSRKKIRVKKKYFPPNVCQSAVFILARNASKLGILICIRIISNDHETFGRSD